MNNKSSSKDTEIIIEREFGNENFLDLYVDVVLDRIAEKMNAERKTPDEAGENVELAC